MSSTKDRINELEGKGDFRTINETMELHNLYFKCVDSALASGVSAEEIRAAFDLDDLVDRATIHMHTVKAQQRAQAEEEAAQKAREKEEKRLAEWAPHIEAIRAALPEEIRGVTIIPRGAYSAYYDHRYEHGPCEIQIGTLRVFAWHWTVRDCRDVLIFAPGKLQLDSADDWETTEVRWTIEEWYRANEDSQPDFMLALGEAAEYYAANWDRLQAEVAQRMRKAAEPVAWKSPAAPAPPTAAEQLTTAIERIIDERMAAIRDEQEEY